LRGAERRDFSGGDRAKERSARMAQGTIKDYDIEERRGSLLQDDHTEVLIDTASTEGSGIRYLRIGQRVVFDVVDEAGRKIARNLKIISFA
jgi:cold shock CspA family protein